VSSVRFGSVSRIRPGEEAEVIAVGIPSAASMCFDPVNLACHDRLRGECGGAGKVPDGGHACGGRCK
jgi:hypothetical protein